KDLLQDMIISYFFSKSGQFYEELYKENIIDSSFYFETNLDKNYGYSIIGGNTNNPEQFSTKITELLLSTNNMKITEEEFERMKRKRIGQLLRSMNSLENIASKFIHYHTVQVDYFDLIPIIQELTVDDANDYLKNWISKDRLSVCTISAE